jgi:hypothetical protein
LPGPITLQEDCPCSHTCLGACGRGGGNERKRAGVERAFRAEGGRTAGVMAVGIRYGSPVMISLLQRGLSPRSIALSIAVSSCSRLSASRLSSTIFAPPAWYACYICLAAGMPHRRTCRAISAWTRMHVSTPAEGRWAFQGKHISGGERRDRRTGWRARAISALARRHDGTAAAAICDNRLRHSVGRRTSAPARRRCCRAPAPPPDATSGASRSARSGIAKEITHIRFSLYNAFSGLYVAVMTSAFGAPTRESPRTSLTGKASCSCAAGKSAAALLRVLVATLLR